MTDSLTDRVIRRGHHSRHAGLSLVEVMISLALSATLVLGIFTLYIDTSQTSRSSDALARVQESARIGLDILARDVRMAGFQGCTDPGVQANVIPGDLPTGGEFNSVAIRGWEVEDATWANGTEFEGSRLQDDAVVGSDVLSIQRGEMTNVRLDVGMLNTSSLLETTGTDIARLEVDQAVVISDCESADVFRIANVGGSNMTFRNGPLSYAYSEGAAILRLSSVAYFVADTGREDETGSPIRALYRGTSERIDDPAAALDAFTVEELVEGVESLQILYGQRLNNGDFQYLPADDPDLEMENVVAVKLGLLVSAGDPVSNSEDDGLYELPGEVIGPVAAGGAVTHPEDRRLRRSFAMTVALRNRY